WLAQTIGDESTKSLRTTRERCLFNRRRTRYQRWSARTDRSTPRRAISAGFIESAIRRWPKELTSLQVAMHSLPASGEAYRGEARAAASCRPGGASASRPTPREASGRRFSATRAAIRSQVPELDSSNGGRRSRRPPDPRLADTAARRRVEPISPLNC